MTIQYNNHNDLNVKKVSIHPHAITRSKERLKIKYKDDNSLICQLRDRLRESKFIGVTYDDEGKERLLYACGGVGYYLTPDKKTLVTVIPEDKVRESPLHSKIIDLHKKEIRKLTRTESARLKRLEEFDLKMNMEVSALRYKIHRSRSKNAKSTYMKQIEEWQNKRELLGNELSEIRAIKKKYSKSLVALL